MVPGSTQLLIYTGLFFRYFVQAPVIMRKLPQTYPVYHILLSLIEEVVKKVLPQTKTAKDKYVDPRLRVLNY